MSQQQATISPERQIVTQMLDKLQQTYFRFPTNAEILMEFADRANRGQPVDADILVDEYTIRVGKRLTSLLAKSTFMTGIGRVYREHMRSQEGGEDPASGECYEP